MVERPRFRPDPAHSREEMEQLQREIASTAVFDDDLPADVHSWLETGDNPPVIAGVDQGFDGDTAISVIVVMVGDEVVEQVHATAETQIPYIPGLLGFREGEAILAAFDALEADPAVVLFDGSGRIHYREAGLATHIGVVLDVPTIGVAKRLLCGESTASLEGGLPAGEQVPIEADESVSAPTGTSIGYAVQTRQYESPDRHINPLYVSPGHRVSAETAATIVRETATSYKLPEPIRRADTDAGKRT